LGFARDFKACFDGSEGGKYFFEKLFGELVEGIFCHVWVAGGGFSIILCLMLLES
jgi:hypothetical protein